MLFSRIIKHFIHLITIIPWNISVVIRVMDCKMKSLSSRKKLPLENSSHDFAQYLDHSRELTGNSPKMDIFKNKVKGCFYRDL